MGFVCRLFALKPQRDIESPRKTLYRMHGASPRYLTFAVATESLIQQAHPEPNNEVESAIAISSVISGKTCLLIDRC